MHERRGVLPWLSRNSGAVFLFVTVFTFLQLGFYAGNHFYAQEPSPSWWDSAKTSTLAAEGVVQAHPIPKLMEDAEAAYKKKVARQSRTLKDAVVEYRSRYGRLPPKGFEKWFEMAMEKNVVMIDEYDGLMEDLEPFYELSGLEVRRRSLQVGSLPSIDIVRIRNGVVKTVNLNKGFEDSEVGARANGFKSMINKVAHLLPDIDFPINAKAESRVIVPWEHRQHPNLTIQDSSVGIETMLGGPFIADWRGDGNVWDAWRRTCPPNSTARRLFSSIRTPFSPDSKNYLQSRDSPSSTSSTSGSSGSSVSSSLNSGVGPDFFFSPDTGYSLDYCNSPHARYSQGHFFSDWRVIPALYPVFSPAKARGFMDIKIPSHYYYGSTARYTYGWDPVNLELKDVDPMEVPWDLKQDKIFWRGATTGGGNNPPGFMPQYQRHRFLRMVSNISDTTRVLVFPDPESLLSPGEPSSTSSPTSKPPTNPPRYLSAPVPISKLNKEIMDIAFTKATAEKAYPGGLEALRRDHRFAEAVPLGRHWSFKYLVDFDGMSYSGRFLAFLASDSAPVKATVYEEFFEGWIQPWVHFIPLSTTYKEIYNIHAFFSGPPEAAIEAIKPNNSWDSDPNSSENRENWEEAGRTGYVHGDRDRDGDGDRAKSKKMYNADGDARLRRIARAGKQWKKT
ncbi:hypothetical protein D9758_013894 [Tetrapyrgos nigripes]|uniref:Glycosyl transferase CAP10 domain-containing protein n=1 Tax=Tetrapyrgos nigripes TaxID=182062 RepID=A0A8H5CNQ5_9AGAR|nr:hypothetical protein D9758_013894 [Tetrapyrgos nigripes]